MPYRQFIIIASVNNADHIGTIGKNRYAIISPCFAGGRYVASMMFCASSTESVGSGKYNAVHNFLPPKYERARASG